MKGWMWLSIATFILCLILKSPFVYMLFYVLSVNALLSTQLPSYVAHRLGVVRLVSSDRLFVGEKAEMSVIIDNPTKLPVHWLTVRQRLPFGLTDASNTMWAFSIGARDKAIIKFGLTANQRGLHWLGNIQSTIADMLGLSEIVLETPMADSILVYPRIYRILGWSPKPYISYGKTRVHEVWYEDPARLAGVRDYRRDDSVRRIHWKSSAKCNHLQVKEFDQTVTAVYNIVLNLDYEDFRYEATIGSDPELAIELAASLAVMLTSSRYLVGLAMNCLDALDDGFRVASESDESLNTFISPQLWQRGSIIIPATKRSGAGPILEMLGRAKSVAGSMPYGNLVIEASIRASTRACILLITPRPNQQFMDLVTRLKMTGRQICVFFVGHPRANQLEYMRIPKVDCYWAEKTGRGEAFTVKSLLDASLGGRLT